MRLWAFTIASAFIGGVAAKRAPYKHVALFSIDGFHGSDVEKYIAKRPQSTIAKLVASGYEYTNTFTSAPSDSFPGLISIVAGASPRTTGIWYDATYDRMLFNPGSDCSGPSGAPGWFRDPPEAL
jgi:predicted AlkP superfamily pyrophosphatase or phosphodiesterase